MEQDPRRHPDPLRWSWVDRMRRYMQTYRNDTM
jgi:hypothetical protein